MLSRTIGAELYTSALSGDRVDQCYVVFCFVALFDLQVIELHVANAVQDTGFQANSREFRREVDLTANHSVKGSIVCTNIRTLDYIETSMTQQKSIHFDQRFNAASGFPPTVIMSGDLEMLALILVLLLVLLSITFTTHITFIIVNITAITYTAFIIVNIFITTSTYTIVARTCSEYEQEYNG